MSEKDPPDESRPERAVAEGRAGSEGPAGLGGPAGLPPGQYPPSYPNHPPSYTGQQPDSPYQQPGYPSYPSQQSGSAGPYPGGYPPGGPVPPYYPGQGWGPPGQGWVPPRPTNALAIVSLVLSILGVFLFFTFVVGIAALVCGYLARNQIRERGEAGDGMALAGIILGWVGIGIGVIFFAIPLIFAVAHGFQ